MLQELEVGSLLVSLACKLQKLQTLCIHELNNVLLFLLCIIHLTNVCNFIILIWLWRSREEDTLHWPICLQITIILQRQDFSNQFREICGFELTWMDSMAWLIFRYFIYWKLFFKREMPFSNHSSPNMELSITISVGMAQWQSCPT